MIKSIRLKNWKSYEDCIMYIDPLTILIGTNSSGKSNVVDALVFLNRISRGVGILQSITGDMTMKSIRGGLDWVCRKGTNCFSIEVELGIGADTYDYYIEVETEPTKALVREESLTRKGVENSSDKTRLFYTGLKDNKALNISTYYWTGKQGKGQNFNLNRNTSILFQTRTLQLRKVETVDVSVEIANILSGIFVLDPIPNHMREYSKLSPHLLSDGSNIAGVLAALEGKKKRETEKMLTSYLKKIPERDIVRVWAETVGAFKTDAMLYCEEGWKEKLVVDAKGMSDGTLRFLAIIAGMLTNDNTSLIVLEEVDNGLHPSRVQILLNMLIELGEKRNIDVVITTHNPAFLDAAGVKMIPFITVAHRGEDGFSKLTLLEDLREMPKLIASGNIGELAADGKIEDALEREAKI